MVRSAVHDEKPVDPVKPESLANDGKNLPELTAVYPSADDIADRAHALFLKSGRRIAGIPECWRAAEEELLDREARRICRDGVQPPGRRKS